jgi:glutathione S-transferase
MITVCHLSTSRSERVVWLLEELGLPYELEWYQREGTGAAPAVMREIHPIGKAPIIRDGELVLAESGAIVEYIVQRYGKGRLSVPPESHAYPQYLYWMHFAEGSLMTLMLIALVLSRVPEAKDSPVKERIGKRVHQLLAFVDGALADREYFAGTEFTAADVMMVFPFTTMRRYLDYDIAPYPNIAKYMQRIESRPAYEKAMRIAGPDVKR